ncbi:hypothetical protein [Phenylobacterium sp. J367]|uniref:hypothetical protein n=1 Tax=Phenylobacterium sp. J367 TaxID=2898435 RepID=UPI0021517BCD|nr:hypothetical protein [Phenylobacterium sp. J367]MCR5881066.1 hypothetical protein [Phenylobacterium sp. J367]
MAAAADISNPHPPIGVDGRPLAETLFRWVDPDLRYWEDRGFALRAAFIHACRRCSEPFWFRGGVFGSWRPNAQLHALTAEGPIETFGVGAAIVVPAYLPGGVIGRRRLGDLGRELRRGGRRCSPPGPATCRRSR